MSESPHNLPAARALIVTADDYGMADCVNRAIDECLEAGTVTSTCVMMNMPECDAAGTLRERFPDASVGIHFNLTAGAPVLATGEVPTLLDSRGRFLSLTQFRRGLVTGRVSPTEALAELRAQYERFREVVGDADFWNTHQNVDLWPGMATRMVGLAAEAGIPAMRSYRRVTVPAHGSAAAFCLRRPKYCLKGLVLAWWARRAAAAGMRLPDGLVYPFGFPEEKADVEQIAFRIPWASLRRGVVELTVHPSTSADGEHFGALTESRVEEYRCFSDARLRVRLGERDIRLAGFEVLDHQTK